MIPQISDELQSDFEFEEESSKTFKLNIDKNTIVNYTDELDAIKQAIYLILNIERYEHVIYSWNYGIEIADLFGKPVPFVLSELKRKIKEALTQDDRIHDVNAFSFEVVKSKVHAKFTVITSYGEIEAEKVVVI